MGKEGRYGHRCIQIPGTTKIMVSAEIIDFESKSVTNTGKMNFKRCLPGIGILTLDGEDKVAILGGSDENNALDSVEVYDQKTQNWKIMSDMKLTQAKYSFGFLTVK